MNFVAFILVLLISLLLLARLLRRVVFGRKRPLIVANKCPCGYTLDALDTIRCPECGRVSGFDATAEELQLTDDQLRQAKSKRDARERLRNPARAAPQKSATE